MIDRSVDELDHDIMKKQITKTSAILSLVLLAAFTFFSGCKVEQNPNSNSYIDGTAEVARQLSDVMASIDEMGGGSGTIHSMATCYGNGFGACASNVVLRNFPSCTTGPFTYTGTVTLAWGGSSAACTMTTIGDYVTRNPNYQSTGSRNGLMSSFKDSGAAIGEQLTWSSGTANRVYTYTNTGIRRTIAVNGTLYYDATLTSVAPLTVNGQNRSGRTMSGGLLKILNNMQGGICTVSPQNVKWNDPNCTCASAGSWQGTCADGSLFRMDMLGCGMAQMTMSNYSESVQLDRCTNN